MIKTRVHIHNEDALNMDPRVYVEVYLPAIPRKGETFFLPEELENEMAEIVNSYEDIACDYQSKWGRGFDKKISFADVIIVNDVRYSANVEFVDIELTDYIDSKA